MSLRLSLNLLITMADHVGNGEGIGYYESHVEDLRTQRAQQSASLVGVTARLVVGVAVAADANLTVAVSTNPTVGCGLLFSLSYSSGKKMSAVSLQTSTSYPLSSDESSYSNNNQGRLLFSCRAFRKFIDGPMVLLKHRSCVRK